MNNNDDMAQTQGTQRKAYVRRMFNAIAHRYDLLNHLLSAGVDIYWRKKAITKLKVKDADLVLDLASGTADLAMEIVKQHKCRVVGVDIAVNMLRQAKVKTAQPGFEGRIRLVNGDGEQLPFPDALFGCVTIAFGIRNMGSIGDALTEMHRVLKPDGQVVILEFSLPQFKPFRTLYLFYFNRLLPFIGRQISGDRAAYSYLPASVEKFPLIDAFIASMQQAGFKRIEHDRLLNGVAVIYRGIK